MKTLLEIINTDDTPNILNEKLNNMKATIKTKNPYTYPTYTVMIGKEVIKAFYSKKEAIEFKNKLNNN
jgi:hypothetical protein